MWRFPSRFKTVLFKCVAWSIRRRDTHQYRQLKLNLSRVLDAPIDSPKVEACAREALASSMRYYQDIFEIIHWTPEQIRTRVVTHNEDRLRNATSSTSVILALPHSGNWDLAGAWCALEIGSLSTVAERLRPESVFRRFVAMREKIGITIRPLKGAGPTYEWLRSEALRGQIVPILSDRDVAKNGLGVEFFGHKANLPLGAALLGVDTKLPVVVCITYYQSGKLHIDFSEPIVPTAEILTGTGRIRAAKLLQQEIVQNLEFHIRNHPQSWQMMQPIWPDLVA
jgi:KDO2-lipid IV(A) lauroyltransferase